MKIAKHRKENKVQGRKQVDHRERKRNPNHPSFLPLLSSSLLYQSSAFHSVLGWSLPFAFPLYHLKTNTKLHTIFNTPTTLSSPTITLSLAPTPLLFFSFLFFRLPPHNLFMAASPWPHSASLLNHILLFIATLLFQQQGMVVMVEATSSWCVARSDASYQALQTALDYACWAGADCTPIQSDGLCFLPNTIQAHASYAFNSYYQRKGMAPGSCDFSGTANIARTDPSAMDLASIPLLSARQEGQLHPQCRQLTPIHSHRR
ncbi:unnamed protein product [Linum tenue]|uniref:X8 domain-containing protein n=1 Tax=Linum tenue TaxID=586396 RepID=A0AAV0H4V3_9ROSI|nr:unnamed protein product [Linum tenue]